MEKNMAAVKFVPLERAVVWAKVGRDPWWPSVVLAAGGGGGGKAWRRKKGGREEFRCVFLQAGETFQWLQVKNLRPFLNEDTGVGRPHEYVVTQPKYQDQHLVAINLGVRILDGGSVGKLTLIEDKEETFFEQEVDVDENLIKIEAPDPLIENLNEVDIDENLIKIEAPDPLMNMNAVEVANEGRNLKCAPKPVQIDPNKNILMPKDISADMLSKISAKFADKTYNQTTGTSCHQCRQKTADTKTICRSGKCVGVRGQFCGRCLQIRYGESVRDALLDPTWSCPPCKGRCNCSICMKRQGKGATGVLFNIAKTKGFNNVSAFLVNSQGKSKIGDKEIKEKPKKVEEKGKNSKKNIKTTVKNKDIEEGDIKENGGTKVKEGLISQPVILKSGIRGTGKTEMVSSVWKASEKSTRKSVDKSIISEKGVNSFMTTDLGEKKEEADMENSFENAAKKIKKQ